MSSNTWSVMIWRLWFVEHCTEQRGRIHRYELITQYKDWTSALRHCGSLGRNIHLVEIANDQQQRALTSYLSQQITGTYLRVSVCLVLLVRHLNTEHLTLLHTCGWIAPFWVGSSPRWRRLFWKIQMAISQQRVIQSSSCLGYHHHHHHHHHHTLYYRKDVYELQCFYCAMLAQSAVMQQ